MTDTVSLAASVPEQSAVNESDDTTKPRILAFLQANELEFIHDVLRELAEVATSSTNNRAVLFEKNYKEMYAAIIQAFPIDKYLAAENGLRPVGADR